MNRTIISLTLLLTTPAFGQPIYKCPDVSGVIRFQQTPCEGGQPIAVKPIPTGAGSGLSDNARAYLAERDRVWAEEAKAQAEADKEERRIAAEHHKARAAEEQAAAQRATAAAIRSLGLRRY
jgi:hypothetical protein